MDAGHDKVSKALADRGRRLRLAWLHAENRQTLGRPCENLAMSCQSLPERLDVLAEASLVVSRSGGAASSPPTSTRCRSTRSPIAGSASSDAGTSALADLKKKL